MITAEILQIYLRKLYANRDASKVAGWERSITKVKENG